MKLYPHKMRTLEMHAGTVLEKSPDLSSYQWWCGGRFRSDGGTASSHRNYVRARSMHFGKCILSLELFVLMIRHT
jgi:hypothetical protein